MYMVDACRGRVCNPHGFVEVLQLLQVLGEALDQEDMCVSVSVWWMHVVHVVDVYGGCMSWTYL